MQFKTTVSTYLRAATASLIVSVLVALASYHLYEVHSLKLKGSFNPRSVAMPPEERAVVRAA